MPSFYYGRAFKAFAARRFFTVGFARLLFVTDLDQFLFGYSTSHRSAFGLTKLFPSRPPRLSKETPNKLR